MPESWESLFARGEAFETDEDAVIEALAAVRGDDDD